MGRSIEAEETVSLWRLDHGEEAREQWEGVDAEGGLATPEGGEGEHPTRVIGVHLGRSEDAVRNKASEESISLKPTNQSPYGTGGKRKK